MMNEDKRNPKSVYKNLADCTHIYSGLKLTIPNAAKKSACGGEMSATMRAVNLIRVGGKKCGVKLINGEKNRQREYN